MFESGSTAWTRYHDAMREATERACRNARRHVRRKPRPSPDWDEDDPGFEDAVRVIEEYGGPACE